jgi:hypothetical protein
MSTEADSEGASGSTYEPEAGTARTERGGER